MKKESKGNKERERGKKSVINSSFQFFHHLGHVWVTWILLMLVCEFDGIDEHLYDIKPS